MASTSISSFQKRVNDGQYHIKRLEKLVDDGKPIDLTKQSPKEFGEMIVNIYSCLVNVMYCADSMFGDPYEYMGDTMCFTPLGTFQNIDVNKTRDIVYEMVMGVSGKNEKRAEFYMDTCQKVVQKEWDEYLGMRKT